MSEEKWRGVAKEKGWKGQGEFEGLKKELIAVRFVKWVGGKLNVEDVVTVKSELSKVRRQYRGWTEAKPTGRKCPKCGVEVLDYGLVNTTDGLVRIFRCSSGECDYVEHKIEFTPEQVQVLRVLGEPLKCRICGRKMKKGWRYCPYCGEEL
jgi:uncharacterized protein (UPF0212 family)